MLDEDAMVAQRHTFVWPLTNLPWQVPPKVLVVLKDELGWKVC